MSFLRSKLRDISRALEFSNIDRLDELQRLLEAGAPTAAVPAEGRPPIRRDFGDDRVIDFCAFAGRTVLKTSGRAG